MIAQPEIYISYLHWLGEGSDEEVSSQYVARRLYHFFISKNFKTYLDNVDVLHGGKLDEFLETYSSGKYIILILDEKYLTIPSCCAEMAVLALNENIYNNLFPIVLPDVKYYYPIDLIDYQYYWDERIKNLQLKLKQARNSLLCNQIEQELNIYLLVRKFISNISALSYNFFLFDSDINEIKDELFYLIDSKFEEETEYQFLQNTPKFMNKCPYFHQKMLIGKKDVLDEIGIAFQSEKIIVLEQSLPGNGKSTIAKAFINNEKYTQIYNQIAWVNIQRNFKHDIISQFENSSLEFGLQKDLSASYKNLIKKLQSLENKNLIVIDNVRSEAELESFLSEIQNSNWHCLVLSFVPIGNYRSISLGTMPNQDAKQLFSLNYKREFNESTLDNFLKIINNHTLSIEIASKSANLNSEITVERLYQFATEAKKSTAGIKNKFLYSNKKHEITEDELLIYKFLSSLFFEEHFSDEEENILRNFSVLCLQSYDDTLLIELFKISKEDENHFFSQIETLIRKGWIQSELTGFSIHPVIQEIVLKNLQPDTYNCTELIEHFTEVLSSEPTPENQIIIKTFLPFAESILSMVQDYDINLALLAERVASYYLSMDNFEKALNVTLTVLEVKQNLFESTPDEIADCCNNISILYGHLGNYRKDLEYGLRALNTRRKILPPEDPSLAQSYNNVAIAYRNLNDFQKAIKYHLRDVRISEEIYDHQNSNLAHSYYETSVTYYHLKDFALAKYYIDKAVKIWKEIYQEDTVEYTNAIEIQELIHKRKN